MLVSTVYLTALLHKERECVEKVFVDRTDRRPVAQIQTEGDQLYKMTKGERQMIDPHKKMNKTGRKNFLKILVTAVMVMTMLGYGVTAYATTETRPDVHSVSPIGGVYAYGHTGYSSAQVSGHTSHGISSAKTITVYGIYRDGSKIKKTNSAYNGTGSSADAAAYVSVPGGATNQRYFIGSHANHYVYYSGITWTDYTAIGEQDF